MSPTTSALFCDQGQPRLSQASLDPDVCQDDRKRFDWVAAVLILPAGGRVRPRQLLGFLNHRGCTATVGPIDDISKPLETKRGGQSR